MANVADYIHRRPGIGLVALPEGGHHPYLRYQRKACTAIDAFIAELRPVALDRELRVIGTQNPRDSQC